MRLGVQLPTLSSKVAAGDVVRYAQIAEALGFDSAWTFDHLFTPLELRSPYPYTADGSYGLDPSVPFLEPVGLLGVLAGATERITLGTAVLIPAYRHPIPLAKALGTIDVLAGGRLTLGLGVGWMEEEFDAVGVGIARRGARFEEHITAMRRIWVDGVCAFAGEFYEWPESSFLPCPPRGSIPLLFGGHADAVLRRVARIGDGWAVSSMLAGGGTLEERLRRVTVDYYRDGLARLRGFCEEEGRPFGELSNLITRPIMLTDSAPADRPLLVGGPDDLLEDLELLSSLGVETVNLVIYADSIPEALGICERIADEVVPSARLIGPRPAGGEHQGESLTRSESITALGGSMRVVDRSPA